MGTFLEQPVCRLVSSRKGAYAHWFGGTPTHSGVIPPGREHPVHLLYDLDLTDPMLGLSSRFPAVSRLPLYNPLQYNCCDMIYRVLRDDAIEIVRLTNPDNPDWYADHPYDAYPSAFPRTPVTAEHVPPSLIERCAGALESDGTGGFEAKEAALEDACLFPRVGGRHFMWQGIPHWECPTQSCPHFGKYGDVGKEVLAVIWERPIPALHLWDDDPEDQHMGSIQIIFSRCTGCGVLHSCNRCD